MPSASPRTPRWRSPPTPCRSTAATASSRSTPSRSSCATRRSCSSTRARRRSSGSSSPARRCCRAASPSPRRRNNSATQLCQEPAFSRALAFPGASSGDVAHETHDSHGLPVVGGDPAVAEVAARQERVVSIAQLRAAGLGRGAVEHRVRRKRLFRAHRGVYVVGPGPLTFRGHLWAAVLATGGIVSHRSAAALWDLLPVPGGKTDITTLRTANSTSGIRIHRRTAVEAVRRDGLPVTTASQTIFDLAPDLSHHRVERLCHRAEVLRLLDAGALTALVDA